MNGDRTYIIQLAENVNKKINISKKYIDTFTDWNKMKSHVNAQKYDVKFVRLLSLLAVGMVNLVQADIHVEVKKFIKDIFEIRAGNNLIRFLQLDMIIDDYIKVLNAKVNTKKL